MYVKFFGLNHEPFSIAPDPRYLYMSERHREALAHLLYGLKGGGGFVLLTGEIGAGKTTVCRCLLEQIPQRCNVAYIFNPKLSVIELLQTVCEEYGIAGPEASAAGPSVKPYVDALNEYLLRTHAVGQNNVLIIDEAQNLSADVLEQLRLLTNLETHERKLLQIMLIGQPELRGMLARPELEQLAQRVIARFHLDALSEAETLQYVRHRLVVAGLKGPLPFDRAACRRIHKLSRGLPRRINLLCDRALLGAYGQGRDRVDRGIVDRAAAEVFDRGGERALASHAVAESAGWRLPVLTGLTGLLIGAGVWALAAKGAWAPAAVPLMGAAPAASAGAVNAALPAAARNVAPASSTGLASAPASVSASAASPAADLDEGIRWAWAREAEAWRDLARVWGMEDLPEGDPCQAFKAQQLQCFKGDGGLALLRLLGRPSVLILRDGNGKPSYVTLLALDGQSAQVRAGGQVQRVNLLRLGRQWRGEFATLWRSPPGYQAVLLNGQRGAMVDWIDAQLNQVFGPGSKRRAKGYDATLKAKLAAFQRAQGLDSDGRVGPVTLMQLNRAAGVDEPRWLTDSLVH